MKILKISLIVVPVLIIAVVLIVFWRLDAIVRSTVENESTAQLNVPANLESANVSIFGGTVSLDDYALGSPKGFDAERMFRLDHVKVGVTYGQLMDQPVRINTIEIERPTLVIEQKDLKLNFKALIDGMPQSTPSADAGEPVRLIIDQLNIKGAAVFIRPGIPGVGQEIELSIPPLELKNIGNTEGAQNGAAIREVVLAVVMSLAQAAAESEQVPAEVRQLLQLDVQQLVDAKLKGLSDELTKAIDAVKADPTKIKDVGKDLEKGLKDVIGKDILGGEKKKDGGK